MAQHSYVPLLLQRCLLKLPVREFKQTTTATKTPPWNDQVLRIIENVRPRRQFRISFWNWSLVWHLIWAGFQTDWWTEQIQIVTKFEGKIDIFFTKCCPWRCRHHWWSSLLFSWRTMFSGKGVAWQKRCVTTWPTAAREGTKASRCSGIPLMPLPKGHETLAELMG